MALYKRFHYSSGRFSSEEVSAQNQVKASVQRKIRQSIAEEVWFRMGWWLSRFYSTTMNYEGVSYMCPDTIIPLIPVSRPWTTAGWLASKEITSHCCKMVCLHITYCAASFFFFFPSEFKIMNWCFFNHFVDFLVN